MKNPPRLLRFDIAAQVVEELRRIGYDQPVEAALGMLLGESVVKIHQLQQSSIRLLREEFSAIGGEIIAPRTLLEGKRPAGDVLLFGSRFQLNRFCRRLEGQAAPLQRIGAEIAVLLERCLRSAAHLAGRSVRLNLSRPHIMGVLNATPDSFSDGGRYLDTGAALHRARVMVEEGADLIDVGGESTRPGAPKVDEEEEIQRVLPVIRAISQELPIPLSIDTTKSRVARLAVAAGANFINDVSGLRFDPDMASVVAETGAGVFLMHTRGRSDVMQKNTQYRDLLGDICQYLAESIGAALAAGVEESHIAIDPGIGFGKDAQGNLEILRRLRELHSLGRPILLGTSRKGFIGQILEQPVPRKRLQGTMATVALGVAQGASIFRVHDIGPARETALIANAIHPYF